MCACVTAELLFGWYLLSTVAHNYHIKTKCSQQITNRSQQIQIAHSKLKSLTANSSRSQQIQGCAFLSRVEGIFSSVEGTLSRVPILQRGNLIIKLS